MNNSSKILLALFLVLGIGTYWYLNNDPKPTSNLGWDRSFKIENTNEIQKIFIADKKGNKTLLERKGNSWIADKTYKANIHVVTPLLNAINQQQLLYVPNAAESKNAINNLGSFGIKVELYGANDKNLKTYYIGGGTATESGCYAILEGSDQPYVLHIPSMTGSIRGRYNIFGEKWRDKTILQEDPNDIIEVTMDYPKQRNKSFVLKRGEGATTIAPLHATTTEINGIIDEGKVNAYLINYDNLVAEAYENENDKKVIITERVPFASLTFRKKDGTQMQLDWHPSLNDQGGISDRYFIHRDKDDLMLIQDRMTTKLFWSYDKFFK